MRLPDDLLQCVCFLCIKRGAGFEFAGTAFFVGHPSDTHPEVSYVYLVTAKHCVVAGEKAGGLYVRMNTVDGKSGMLQINTQWVYATDPGADVAAISWAPPSDKYQYKTIPLSM